MRLGQLARFNADINSVQVIETKAGGLLAEADSHRGISSFLGLDDLALDNAVQDRVSA